MPELSSGSPFGTPIQEPKEQQPVVQQTQPQEATFQPSWNEEITRFHTGTYRKNPQSYTSEQLDSIRKHATYYGVPFYEGEFSMFEAVKQAGAGFFEGFTTVSIADHPDNEYEAVVRNLAHLAGFVPGILVKPLNAIKATGLARGAAAIKSVPMLTADFVQRQAKKIISPALKSARASRFGAVKAATDFLAKQGRGEVAKHILQGAFHLGVASSVSSWKQGVSGMMDSFVGGAVAGGVFRSIGNFIKVGNPQGDKMVRALAGSLFMGLPSTIQGSTTPEQIYEYVMGAYFGGSETSAKKAFQFNFLKKMEKRASVDPEFAQKMEPELMKEWDKVPDMWKESVKDMAENGIPGTEFIGYRNIIDQRNALTLMAEMLGVPKSITDKGELIIESPDFKAIGMDEKTGEMQYSFQGKTYKTHNKVGYSGAAVGADSTWELIFNERGLPLIHYLGPNQKQGKGARIVQRLSPQQVKEATQRVAKANLVLQRGDVVDWKPETLEKIQRNWFQVRNAETVFAVGELATFKDANKNIITKKGEVAGGTGWATQMGIDKGIDVYLLNTKDAKWYRYNRTSKEYEPATPPKELPRRAAYVGTRKLDAHGLKPAVEKKMESLVAQEFEVFRGTAPKMKHIGPKEVQLLRKSRKRLNDILVKMVADFNQTSKNLKKEQKKFPLNPKKIEELTTRKETLNNDIRKQKREIAKIDKQANLEDFDEKGFPKIAADSTVSQDGSSPGVAENEGTLGGRLVHFIEKHFEDLYKNQPQFETDMLARQGEKLRLANILKNFISDYTELGSTTAKSEGLIKALEGEMGKGFSLGEQARRDLRVWLVKRNQEVPVRHYGYAGRTLFTLSPYNPVTRGGQLKAQMRPLNILDKIYHDSKNFSVEERMDAINRGFEILDHATIYNNSANKYVDEKLGSIRRNDVTNNTNNYDWIIRNTIAELEKKGKHIFGGVGDKDRLTIVRYHPLLESLDTKTRTILLNKYPEAIKHSRDFYGKVWNQNQVRHDNVWMSNMLYNMEMNGFKLGEHITPEKISDIITKPLYKTSVAGVKHLEDTSGKDVTKITSTIRDIINKTEGHTTSKGHKAIWFGPINYVYGAGGGRKALHKAKPMPQEIIELKNKVEDSLDLPRGYYDSVLMNKLPKNTKIGAHKDDEAIFIKSDGTIGSVGVLSFGGEANIDIQRPYKKVIESHRIKSGDIYELPEGNFQNLHFHAVGPSKGERLSLTFRRTNKAPEIQPTEKVPKIPEDINYFDIPLRVQFPPAKSRKEAHAIVDGKKVMLTEKQKDRVEVLSKAYASGDKLMKAFADTETYKLGRELIWQEQKLQPIKKTPELKKAPEKIPVSGFRLGQVVGEYLDAMSEDGFINSSPSYNKRLPIWFTNGYSADAELAKEELAKSNPLTAGGNLKYYISEDLSESVMKKIVKEGLNDKSVTAIAEILGEGMDGAIIVPDKVAEFIQKDTGANPESYQSKSFIVSPDSKYGALLGKYMIHPAGPEQSKAMEEYVNPDTNEKGLHMIVLRSAAKQIGLRDVGNHERNSDGSLFLSPNARGKVETYELPLSDLKHVPGIRTDNHFLKQQQLPKQILSNMLVNSFVPIKGEVLSDMIDSLIKIPFRGDVEANKLLRDYLEMPSGTEKEALLNKIDKNINKLGIRELLQAMHLNGEEKLTLMAYRRMMKLNREWLDSEYGEGGITDNEFNDSVALLNEARSVVEKMFILSPTLPILLHKSVNKYREKVLKNFITQQVTKPTIPNSAETRMRPYDRWLIADLKKKGIELSEDTFLLDEGMRNLPIFHNISGRKERTLGELWDARKSLENTKGAADETADIDKILTAMVARVPIAATSGVQKLKFVGFTGRKGHGSLLHGRTMRALSGADLDGDGAFVFFGGKGAMKESWKDAFHSNRKEFYQKNPKTGDIEVSEGKDAKVPKSVKKELGIKVDTMEDLLVEKDVRIKYWSKGTTKSELIKMPTLTESPGMIYSPFERLRISNTTVDGRAQLSAGAVNPKQIMQSAIAAISAKKDGKNEDSWRVEDIYISDLKAEHPIRMTVEVRTGKDFTEYQRMLSNAQVQFTSDPADVGGLKSQKEFKKLLFDSYFKVKKIEVLPKKKGKKELQPLRIYTGKKLENQLPIFMYRMDEFQLMGVNALKPENKSTYGLFNDINKAYYSRNIKQDRAFTQAEIKSLTAGLERLEPGQINSSLAHIATALKDVNWSDSLTSRLDPHKMKNLYSLFRDNIKKFDWLKALMSRTSMKVNLNPLILRTIEKLTGPAEIKRIAESSEEFYNFFKDIPAFSFTKEEIKRIPKWTEGYQKGRMEILTDTKALMDDFVSQNWTDMVSLTEILKIAPKLSESIIKDIPLYSQFADAIKNESYIARREKEDVNTKKIIKIVESKDTPENKEKLINTVFEESKLGKEDTSVPTVAEKKSAALSQQKIDKKIKQFKDIQSNKDNPELRKKLIDLFLLGSYKYGNLEKIDSALQAFKGKWSPDTLDLLKTLRYEAAKTSMSQLGFMSDSVDNRTKKQFLNSYLLFARKAFEAEPEAKIEKELNEIDNLISKDNKTLKEEDAPKELKTIFIESGVEGLTLGKASMVKPEDRAIIANLVANIKSYNNKVSEGFPEIVRGVVHKNLNAMNMQDINTMNNFFNELKRGTIFQMFNKKDLQKLQKRHWWLFPKTVSRELMKYDIELMEDKGFFTTRHGQKFVGPIKVPTTYLDMLQTWTYRLMSQADKKTEEWLNVLTNDLLFVSSFPEGEILRRGAVHLRQKGIAEDIRSETYSDRTQQEKERYAAEYDRRWNRWEKENGHLMNKRFTITEGVKRHELTGREIMDKVNRRYTKFFKDRYAFMRGDPTLIEGYRDYDDKAPYYVKYKVKQFIDDVQKAWRNGEDIVNKYGVDGLRLIARSIQGDLAQAMYAKKGAKDKSVENFINILNTKPITETKPMSFEKYWPHMEFDRKMADDSLRYAYRALKNDKEMSAVEKEKGLAKLIYKHHRLTGDWHFKDIEEWGTYEDVLKDIADKKGIKKEYVKYFEEDIKMGAQYHRESHIPGWSVDTTIPESYARSLSQAYFRQLSNIFGRYTVGAMQMKNSSFRKKFGDEQTEAWANFMKLYLQDAMGHPSVVPDKLIEDPTMNLKGTPYAWWADNKVQERINKTIEKLGLSKTDLPKELRGVSLQQVRHWSNLEAQFEMASLLAHPKSMITNIFGGTMHTIQSTGLRNFLDARNIKWLQENISNEFDSKEAVDRFVVGHGVLPEYMIAEFGVRKELQSVRNKQFIQDIFNKWSKDPNLKEKTLYELQKKYGVKDRVVQFAAKFMSKPERAIRRDAFMSHYIQAWKNFGGAIEDPNHPFLIEIAKKGVQSTQFLYNAAFRPAFARTALGKVLTRFQMWAWNSVRFRNEVSRQARIYGLRPGTESYNKFVRTSQTDLFMFALANAFMYSIFETALPAPYNWYQDTADWIFGDENERNKAFYGQWPTQVAPLQMITPPILRMLPATARAMMDDDWSKVSGYYAWTMFPFGRMARDVVGPGNLIENPLRGFEKIAGLPAMQATRKMAKIKKEKQPKTPSPSIF